MSFFEYQLKSEAMCLGERVKKGTYRPTAMTIPYSQITGALKTLFGRQNIHATGYIINARKTYLTFSPKDNVIGVSKLPIITEVLTNVDGRVFIVKNEDVNDLPNSFQIMIGALKTKGLGVAQLFKIREILLKDKRAYLKHGLLNTRIPLEHLEKFAIEFDKEKMKAVYGYLFKPTSLTSGYYLLSLFEGSEVYGPREFLKEMLP